jgi:hypothetical protein
VGAVHVSELVLPYLGTGWCCVQPNSPCLGTPHIATHLHVALILLYTYSLGDQTPQDTTCNHHTRATHPGQGGSQLLFMTLMMPSQKKLNGAPPSMEMAVPVQESDRACECERC